MGRLRVDRAPLRRVGIIKGAVWAAAGQFGAPLRWMGLDGRWSNILVVINGCGVSIRQAIVDFVADAWS